MNRPEISYDPNLIGKHIKYRYGQAYFSGKYMCHISANVIFVLDRTCKAFRIRQEDIIEIDGMEFNTEDTRRTYIKDK
ncbi:hypothetical protein FACS1894208_05050 [Clostridia bacterium]|nr:hypothetical protein FACS1894208_05050 [Clostridia bacterium]